MNGSVLPLTIAVAGEELRVHSLRGCNGEAQRLRELGLLEGRTIRLIGNHDPVICQIGDCRFGLCRNLAENVLVSPLRKTP